VEQKIKVGVLFGGRSGEHEVSLVSASSVIAALDRSKYEVIPIGIAPDGRWISSAESLAMLKARQEISSQQESFLVPGPHRRALVNAQGQSDQTTIDVVFPVLHGTYGEDGTIQGLLELANLPYVGAGVLASAAGLDKIVQKQLFAEAGLPIVRYRWFLSKAISPNGRKVVSDVERHLRYPVFVKPSNAGSSVGITKAHNRRELLEGLSLAASYDRKVIVEQGVKNVREIECAVLGNDAPIASMPGEIIPSNEFYDYDAKYVDGKSTAIIPAGLPKRVTKDIQRIAARAFAVLDCAGMARIDFFVTAKKAKIYLNEVNTIPGFTSISMYPKLWEASGLPYPALLDKLISLAIERHREKNSLKTSFNPTADWYRE
jgi:D-alanine-D-alanine ligase